MNNGSEIRVTEDITKSNGMVIPAGSTGRIAHVRGGSALVEFSHLTGSTMLRMNTLRHSAETV